MQTNSPTASKSLLWAAATSLEVIWVLSTVQPGGPSCPACQHPQPRQQPVYTADPPTSRNRACRRHAPRGCSPSEAVTHSWFINMLKYKSGGGVGRNAKKSPSEKQNPHPSTDKSSPTTTCLGTQGWDCQGLFTDIPSSFPLAQMGSFHT